MMRYFVLLTIVLFIITLAGCGRSDALADQPSPAPVEPADTTPSLRPTPTLFSIDVIKSAVDQAIAERHATAFSTTRMADTTPICPTDWADPLNTTLSRACEKIPVATRGTADTLREQDQLTQIAVTTPQIESDTLPSYAVTVTPGGPLTIPLVAIQQFDSRDAADGPEQLRHSQSIWRLGKLPGHAIQSIDALFILTRAPYPGWYASIIIAADGDDIGPGSWPQYNGVWHAPYEMGTMQITSITGVSILATGLTGTAVFTTSTGASGTFDLATHAWTITAAGTPSVEPQAAPDITPTLGASAIP